MPRRPKVNTGDPLADARAALTPKEQALVHNVAAGAPSIIQAALAAGYAPSTAKSDAYSKLSQPALQAYMRALVAAGGAPEEAIAKKMAENILHPTQTIVDKFGNEHVVHDYRVSNEAIRTYGQMTGYIGPRDRNEGPAVTVNINVHAGGFGTTVDADTFADVTEGEILSEEQT